MQVASLFDEELTLNKTIADVKSGQQEGYVIVMQTSLPNPFNF